MREPSEPFLRIGGATQADAIFNRISAIKRIEFLCGVDLARESSEFKKLIDAEMYQRFYKDYPADHQIDEEFCQRCAEIVRELNDNKNLETLKEGADERVKELYQESRLHPSIPTELNKVTEPETLSLFKRILTWNWNKQSSKQ